MAIKGTGFDNSNIKNVTIATGDTLEIDGSVTSAEGLTVTTGGVATDTLTTTGDASVGGDLTVTGDIISRGTVDLVVSDNFIDLNAGNSSTTALASGFTFSLNRNSGFTTSTVTTFVAGVASTSNPTFTATDAGSSSLLVAGDVVFITGATEGSNDGLYVVESVNQASFPQVVTVKGVGTVATVGDTPWAQTQFTADTGDSASAYKVDLKVIAIADGSNFPDAGGTANTKGTTLEIFASNAVESDFTGNGDYTELGAASSLQVAYATGNTISVDSSNGDLLIDSDSAATNNVRFGNSTNFAAFSADAAEVILEATGSSGGDMVLAASNASGTVQVSVNSNTVIEAASALIDLNTDIDFGKATGSEQLLKRLSVADGDDLKIALTGANDASLLLESAGTGNDAIGINASAGGVDIAGVAASKFNVTGDDLTLSTTTSGTLAVSSAGAFDIDGAAASSMNVTGADLTVETTTSGAIVIDSAENIDMNAVGGVTVDGTAISIDGTSASNLTTTGANLTVSTATSGTLALTSAGAFDIDGAAASTMTVTGADLTLETASSGGIIVNSIETLDMFSDDALTIQMDANDAGPVNLQITANNAGAGDAVIVIDADNVVKLTQASNDRLIVNSNGINLGGASVSVNTILDQDDMSADSATALATQQSIKAYVDSVAGAATITLEAAASIGARDVVAIALTGGDAGKAIQADADSADTCQVIGFAEASASIGDDVIIRTSGNLTGFSGLTAGDKLFADTVSPGGVTDTAPSGSGDVIFQVGYARTATEVIIVPQFIMELG